jgi:hypothetical protein
VSVHCGCNNQRRKTTSDGIEGFFFSMSHAEQAERIRKLINGELSEAYVAGICGWSRPDVCRAVAEGQHT